MKVVNTSFLDIPAMREQNGRRIGTLLAVLTEDNCGSQAVYVGIVRETALDSDYEREKAINFVCGSGSKQSYERALYWFPSLKSNKYRR